MRILVVETSWSSVALSHALTQNKRPVTRCECVDEAMAYAQMGQQDVIVADAALGADDRRALLLAAPHTPVCLLMRGHDPAQVAAWLHAGAHDVIDNTRTHPDEIIVRVLSVARRALGAAHPRIERGPLHLDVLQRRAFLFDVPLALSPKLYETLEHLALRPGRMVSKEQLLSHIYAQEEEPSQRVFDVYICKLRAALAITDGRVSIETARAKGYRLTLTTCRETVAHLPHRRAAPLPAQRRKSDLAA